jgi:hypothetical protein
MNENDVRMLLQARRDNYDVRNIVKVRGRVHRLTLKGKDYNAVVLVNSFQFYEYRYHLLGRPPDLVICFSHDTALPVPCLSLRAGSYAEAYELPASITDVATQRASKTGARTFLGMYLSGMKTAHALMQDLPGTTRRRYLRRVGALSKKRRSRPVVGPGDVSAKKKTP